MALTNLVELNSFDLMKSKALTYEQKQQMHKLGDTYLKYFSIDDWLAVYLRYQQKTAEAPDERRERLRNAYQLLGDLAENGDQGLMFKAKLMKRMLLEHEFDGKEPN